MKVGGFVWIALALMLAASGCKKKQRLTLLHEAAGDGRMAEVESLLADGADENARDWSGETPLHCAVRCARADVAKLLIESGADVNSKELSGDTPLHVAARWGHWDVVALLLDAGANVSARNSDGNTALHESLWQGKEEIVALLVARGADVDAVNAMGETALHLAAGEGATDVARLLVSNGADLNLRRRGGRALLHDAAQGGHFDFVAFLLERGADANAVDEEGWSALHFAAEEGHVRVAEMLVARGVDLDMQAPSGLAPIHCAARHGRYGVVELLVAEGADIEVKTGRGRTALDCARDAGHADIVALLARGGSRPETGVWDSDTFPNIPADDANEVRGGPLTDIEKLVRGNTAFAIDLYRRLRAREGNLFFSPYSISTALAMTYAAARQDTEREMRETLHFLLAQHNLHRAFADLRRTLNEIQATGNFEIHSASSLWPQEGKPFLTDYLTLLETHYGVLITPVDYTTEASRESARRTINTWVEDQTKAKIKDLIQPDHLEQLTRLVLTNAVYFRGKWEEEFNPKDTKQASFYTSLQTTVDVSLMGQKHRFRYAEFGPLQVLELPYRGGEVSMLILLSRRIEGLRGLEESLSVEGLRFCTSRLVKREVVVFLPKFKICYGVELKDALRALGMVRAFKLRDANFAGFDGDAESFYISDVLHKAFVDVNEEGTEAAAATAEAIMMGCPPAPPVFRADHPFLFLVQENRTGSILFMGRVTNPSRR